jgi:uncharacterized protein YsxB (DUF464 family)
LEGVEEKVNRLEKFIKFLQDYQNEGGFIGVMVSLPNQDKPELIVNVPESLITKITYYSNAYNPDLTLKTNPEVKIVSYCWVSHFETLAENYERLLEEL